MNFPDGSKDFERSKERAGKLSQSCVGFIQMPFGDMSAERQSQIWPR